MFERRARHLIADGFEISVNRPLERRELFRKQTDARARRLTLNRTPVTSPPTPRHPRVGYGGNETGRAHRPGGAVFASNNGRCDTWPPGGTAPRPRRSTKRFVLSAYPLGGDAAGGMEGARRGGSPRRPMAERERRAQRWRSLSPVAHESVLPA